MLKHLQGELVTFDYRIYLKEDGRLLKVGSARCVSSY